MTLMSCNKRLSYKNGVDKGSNGQTVTRVILMVFMLIKEVIINIFDTIINRKYLIRNLPTQTKIYRKP